MHSAFRLLAVILWGIALGACGSSSPAPSGASDRGDGGPDASAGDAAMDGSDLSDGSDSSSSADSATDGAVVYAIPLAAPEGVDFEYTVQATVGNQSFAMLVDTASTTAAVAGTGCVGCPGVSPLWVASPNAVATGETASSEQDDGSEWSGPIYTDAVSLGRGSPSVSLEFVDITKATSFFSGDNDYQGTLGLGPSQDAIANTVGYMPTLASAGARDIFALELCDNTGDNAGTLWLGGAGSHGSAAVYTPLLAISQSNPFYTIHVDGMSLGSANIVTSASSPPVQPLVDTGTSAIYLPTSLYSSFVTALEESSGFKTLFDANVFATSGTDEGCVTGAGVTDAQVESALPSLTVTLPNAVSGEADVTIQASALDTYLYDGSSSGEFCLAVADGGTQATFGDAFLQAFVTVIDIESGRVGFAPTGCPAPQIRHSRRHTREKRGRLLQHRNPSTNDVGRGLAGGGSV